MLLWDAAVGWGSRARRVRCSRLPLVSGGTAVPDQNASFRQAGLRRWDPSLATAANPVELRSHTTRPFGASSADARPNLDQRALRRAPSGPTPVVRYRHKATRSLRARATALILRTRPRAAPTRSWNQRANLLSG